MNPLVKKACLTFDDGPNGEYTLQILDILEKHKKKALFFFPAMNVERQPDIALSVQTQGHLIGNHTYDHPHLNTLTKEQVLWQIERSEEIFQSILGIIPKYFRPTLWGIQPDCRRYNKGKRLSAYSVGHVLSFHGLEKPACSGDSGYNN